MENLRSYSDDRAYNSCTYCGSLPDTLDHVPSKVLLDEPFPNNLAKVPACRECNEAFSMDEEYFAALTDCVLSSSTDIANLRRQKVRDILSRKPDLQERLTRAKSEDGKQFSIELDRVNRVIVKFARAHVKYEEGYSPLTEPTLAWFGPLTLLNKEAKEKFREVEFTGESTWPEVGSRAMQRILIANDIAFKSPWVTVQDQRYRYWVDATSGLAVRVVVDEHFVGLVYWDDPT